jgi:NADH-quinone oxidoreductase subunit K
MGASGQIIFFILAVLIIILSVIAVTCRNLTWIIISMLGALAVTAGLFFLTKYYLLAILQLVLFTAGTGVLTFYALRTTGLTHLIIDTAGWKRSLIVAIGSTATAALTIITILNFRFHGITESVKNGISEGMTIHHFLVLSTILFFIGIHGFLTRLNLFAILISSVLIINSANVNFIAFNRYLYPENNEGVLFGIFTVVFSVAGAALAIAIIYNIFKTFRSVNIDEAGE